MPTSGSVGRGVIEPHFSCLLAVCSIIELPGGFMAINPWQMHPVGCVRSLYARLVTFIAGIVFHPCNTQAGPAIKLPMYRSVSPGMDGDAL